MTSEAINDDIAMVLVMSGDVSGDDVDGDVAELEVTTDANAVTVVIAVVVTSARIVGDIEMVVETVNK